MIPMKKAIDAVATFVQKDVVSAMPPGVHKFLAIMAVNSARQKPEQFVRPYEKWLRMTGIMSDGGIDEQALCSALEAAFSEMKSVSFLGFTSSMQDAERLLQRMVE